MLALLTRPLYRVELLPSAIDDPISGENTPLALHLLYELHYRGLAGVNDRWEWNPYLLGLRAELEAELEQRLFEMAGPIPVGRTSRVVGDDLGRTDAPLRRDGPKARVSGAGGTALRRACRRRPASRTHRS